MVTVFGALERVSGGAASWAGLLLVLLLGPGPVAAASEWLERAPGPASLCDDPPPPVSDDPPPESAEPAAISEPASPSEPALEPRPTTRARLNRILSVQAQLLLPAAALLETDEPPGRGVWTQPAAGLSLSVRPHPRLFATVTLHAYPKPGEREDWVPDFTYVFGYEHWRPFTFYLVHANYTATRYPWWVDRDHPVARPAQGVTTLGWRYQWPGFLRARLHFPSSLWMGGTLATHYALRYSRLEGDEGSHFVAGSLSAMVTFRQHWFAELRAYLYPVPDQQQPWDPDFSYSLGYMDWRPWRVSVRWNNYAGNRWPGRTMPGNGGLSSGALVIALSAGF